MERLPQERRPFFQRIYNWYDNLPIWGGIYDPTRRHLLQAGVAAGALALAGGIGGVIGLNKKYEIDSQTRQYLLDENRFQFLPNGSDFQLFKNYIPPDSAFVDFFHSPHQVAFANGTFSNPESILSVGWNHVNFSPQEDSGFVRLPPLGQGEEWKIYARAESTDVQGFYKQEGQTTDTPPKIIKWIWLAETVFPPVGRRQDFSLATPTGPYPKAGVDLIVIKQ